MMRRLALKLNAAGIWPIYSTFNGFFDTKYRNCPFPYDEYYRALADVGWFRFCASAMIAVATSRVNTATDGVLLNQMNLELATPNRRVVLAARPKLNKL